MEWAIGLKKRFTSVRIVGAAAIAALSHVIGSPCFSAAPQPENPRAVLPTTPERSADTNVSNDPWPVLSDGRLAFDIYDRRIAIAPCSSCLRDVEFYVESGASSFGTSTWLKLEDVIREPRRLRRAIVDSRRIGIRLGNSWGEKDLFLDRFDRRTLPNTPWMILTIYRQAAAHSGCWPGAAWGLPELCRSLIEAATLPPARRDPAGLVVLHNGPELFNGSVRYVVPLQRVESAIGLPMYFECDVFKTCANGPGPGTGPAFFSLRT